MSEKLSGGRVATAFMTVIAFAACGGGDAPGGAPASDGGAATGTPMANPVDAATAGSVGGMVTFSGTPPAPQPIDMREEAVCAAKHTTPPVRDVVVVGSGGGLANVFVYVKSGPVTSMQFPAATEAKVIDQVGCQYTPHVVGLQVGQTLTVRNSDAVLHNVAASPQENRPFNRTQPQAGMEFQTTFPLAEVMIPVRCDVHGWMESYIGVLAHPYFSVTTDAGSFSLDNLPPGSYEIEAWHEQYGVMTQTVVVPASGRADVTFQFGAEMAGRPVPMGAPMVVDHATGTLRPAAAGVAHAHTGH